MVIEVKFDKTHMVKTVSFFLVLATNIINFINFLLTITSYSIWIKFITAAACTTDSKGFIIAELVTYLSITLTEWWN